VTTFDAATLFRRRFGGRWLELGAVSYYPSPSGLQTDQVSLWRVPGLCQGAEEPWVKRCPEALRFFLAKIRQWFSGGSGRRPEVVCLYKGEPEQGRQIAWITFKLMLAASDFDSGTDRLRGLG
jgi:hypothetical protein